MDAQKMYKEKVRWELQKNAVRCLEQIQEATPNKTTVVRPLGSHFIHHEDEQDMQSRSTW